MLRFTGIQAFHTANDSDDESEKCFMALNEQINNEISSFLAKRKSNATASSHKALPERPLRFPYRPLSAPARAPSSSTSPRSLSHPHTQSQFSPVSAQERSSQTSPPTSKAPPPTHLNRASETALAQMTQLLATGVILTPEVRTQMDHILQSHQVSWHDVMHSALTMPKAGVTRQFTSLWWGPFEIAQPTHTNGCLQRHRSTAQYCGA